MKGSVLSVMLKGVCVGSTMMVPGVSGGSMAMLLGIYDRLIYSVNSIRSGKSLLLLGTFSIGGFIGILLFSQPLLSLLGGKVPVVVVDHHGDESADVYGTITHNRARGTHLLEPMKAIVKKLIDEGKTVEEIGKQLGMKPEEIFRLSGFTKDEFLNMMTKGHDTYSKAQVIRSV